MTILRQTLQRSLQRRPAWLNFCAIVVAVLLLLALSWWTVIESHKSLQENLASKLKTILKIETEAVGQWFDSQKQFASFLASDSELAALLGSGAAQEQPLLKAKLAGISNKLDNQTCLLLSPNGSLIASAGKPWQFKNDSDMENLLCETSMSGEPIVSPAISGAKEQGEGSFAVMIAAPVHDSDDAVVGFLGVRHDLGKSLSEVLASSHGGRTGETVAISSRGELISSSRFADAANRRMLPVAMIKDSSRKTAATQVELAGTPDYRSVDCVFASRWLPELGFGLVAKMDAKEAMAPVNRIEHFVLMLFGFLTLSTSSTLFYRWYLLRIRLLAQREEISRKRLGAYCLEEKIGEGSMGVVYKATHELLRRQTAVKILPPERSNDESIARFEREVQFTSQLKHPNTISIYDYGRTESGLFYYAMELLDGMDLEELVRREGKLPDGRVIAILRQSCESLREAHGLGLVHRDIKPANIMLCNQGGAIDTVKVLDFGMVRESASGVDHGVEGSLSGTPMYMAPESFTSASDIDVRADIFALGAVAFFVLTGRPMFNVSSMNELLQIHEYGAHLWARKHFAKARCEEGVAISIDLVKLICDCVGPIEHRPATVDEMLHRLSQCEAVDLWHATTARQWWAVSDVVQVEDENEKTRNKVSASSLAKTQVFVPKSMTEKRNDIQSIEVNLESVV